MKKYRKIEIIDGKIILTNEDYIVFVEPPTRMVLTCNATQQTRKIITHKKIKIKSKDIRQRNLATWINQ